MGNLLILLIPELIITQNKKQNSKKFPKRINTQPLL